MSDEVLAASKRAAEAAERAARCSDQVSREVREHAETDAKQHGEIVRSLLELRMDVSTLWRRVRGSVPPPSQLAAPAAFAGQVKAELETPVETQIQKLTSRFDDLDAWRAQVTAELKKQSTMMGIGATGLAWLKSAEGRNTIIRLATLAGAAYAAFHAAMGK